MGDGIYTLIGHYNGLHQQKYTMLVIVYRESEMMRVEGERDDWRDRVLEE